MKRSVALGISSLSANAIGALDAFAHEIERRHGTAPFTLIVLRVCDVRPLRRLARRALSRAARRMLRTDDLLAMHEDLLFVALNSERSAIVRDARSLCERLACAMRADVDIDLESGWTFIRDRCDAAALIAAAREALHRVRRSRERNDLLAADGHEIRTPLTSIRGYIETVLDDDANRSEERRFLMTAQREAARL
ncbi:MAG: histidine kinase dimerization/phospho-acceptor domain-containing protein, partial [Vulcanimicrobiaceae bacterium]